MVYNMATGISSIRTRIDHRSNRLRDIAEEYRSQVYKDYCPERTIIGNQEGINLNNAFYSLRRHVFGN